MRGSKLLLSALFVAAVMTAAAWATEGGGGAYPNGAEGFMTGAVPPPGNYVIDYNLYYTANKFMDNNGDEIPAKFDLTVGGTIVRLIHVTHQHFLGANWAQQIFVPLLYEDVTPPGAPASSDKFGLGDLIVDPVVLAWHTKKLHIAAGLDTYVPVGSYSQTDPASLGRNYWTFEPVVACTYLDKGWDLSAKAMYDVNLKNNDTDVESGDEFHVDYAVGKTIKAYKLGAGGYYYQQVGDDKYPVGYPAEAQLGKGKAMGLGPQVAYQKGHLTLIGAYQREFDVENKPEGDRFWLKLILPL